MTGCKFCGRRDGVLLVQAASSDFVRARRGFRAIGIASARYHQSCMDEYTAFEAESRERTRREMEANNADLRKALAEEKKS